MTSDFLAPAPIRDPDDWPPDRPLVSVVIPCFNYGHFVEEAVDSALEQTFTNLEVIVVEGGSSKIESRLQVASLIRPRTRLLFQGKAARAGANRNLGIEHALGK